jgi:hypothetical protein
MRIDSAGNAFLGAAAYTSTSLGLAATRRYLVMSSPDAGSIGVITFVGQTGNQGNNGNIEWYDPGNTSSSSIRNAFIFSGSSGVTANNRGSFMAFATKADGISGGGSEAMRIDSSGNLGIGLSGPVDSAGYGGKILDVNGPIYSRQNSDNTKYISIGTSAGASYIEANGSANLMSFITTAVERMRLDSSGNALIGTTSAFGTLTVDTSKGATGVVFGDIGTFANDTQLYMRTSGLAKFLNAGGSFTWGPSGGGEQMRLNSSGNLGIGTSTGVASGKGIAVYDSGGVARLQLRNPTTGDTTADGSSLFVSGLDFGLENREAGNMLFYTNGALRQTIDSSGNVGIGVTPVSLLHTSSASPTWNHIASSGNAVFRMADSPSSGTRKELTITLDNTNNRVDIQAIQQGVAARDITLNVSGGNVGIGATPSVRLHVKSLGAIIYSETTTARGSGNNYFQFRDPSGDKGFLGYGGATDLFQVSQQLNADMALYTNNTERMRIDASGNAGIGGTPTYKLDVLATGSPVIRVASTDGSGVSAYLQANSNVDARFGSISNHPVSLVTNSNIYMTLTTDGRFYGAALHDNGGSVTGTTNQYIASGTYTPTITNTTNVDASTARLTSWMRVGNVVTVGGQFDVDATSAANTYTEVGISLPIASNFTTAFQLGGTGASSEAVTGGGPAASIVADSTNDRAQFYYRSQTASNTTFTFTFTYQVA